MVHKDYRDIVLVPHQAITRSSSSNAPALNHNTTTAPPSASDNHGYQVKSEVLHRQVYPGFIAASSLIPEDHSFGETIASADMHEAVIQTSPPIGPQSKANGLNLENLSSPTHLNSTNLIPQESSGNSSHFAEKELNLGVPSSDPPISESPIINPSRLASALVECMPYLAIIGSSLSKDAPYTCIDPRLLSNSIADIQISLDDDSCPAPPPPPVIQQASVSDSALTNANKPISLRLSRSSSPNPTPPPPAQQSSISRTRPLHSSKEVQFSQTFSNRKRANSASIGPDNTSDTSIRKSSTFKGDSRFDSSPRKSRISSSSSSSSSEDSSNNDSNNSLSKTKIRSGEVSLEAKENSMDIDSDVDKSISNQESVTNFMDVDRVEKDGLSDKSGEEDNSADEAKRGDEEKSGHEEISEPNKDVPPSSGDALSYVSEEEKKDKTQSGRLVSLKKILPSESEEEGNSALGVPAPKRLKTTIGRLPRARRKRNPPRGPKAIADDQMEVNSADDELEEEEKTTGHCPTTPPPRHKRVPSEERSSEELQKDAFVLLKAQAYTACGLDSSEASLILAAVLGLKEEERQMLLNIPHKELVTGFKDMAKKKMMKHRETEHIRSPEHKRPRRGL